MRSTVLAALAVAIGGTTFAAAPAELSVRDAGDGTVLTDARGMTLYRFDMDKEPGKSACVGDCAKAWPPLLAGPDAKPIQGWSLVVRDDGARQWAHDGKPLYRYALDSAPGDENGNRAVFNLWHVDFQPMATPPGITVHESLLGRVLADATGATLYVFDGDKPGRSLCNASCADDWTPLTAPAIANPLGDWSVVMRDDGTRQWAFKSRPLYVSASDLKPGKTSGDGRDNAWHAAVLRPLAKLPAGMTFQTSDLGQVVADNKGNTLYTLTESPNRQTVCDDACISANWRPMVAPAAGLRPGPGWSVVARPDGLLQWTYKTKPIFLYVGDKKPGDIRGDRFGNMSSGGLAPWEVLQPEL